MKKTIQKIDFHFPYKYIGSISKDKDVVEILIPMSEQLNRYNALVDALTTQDTFIFTQLQPWQDKIEKQIKEHLEWHQTTDPLVAELLEDKEGRPLITRFHASFDKPQVVNKDCRCKQKLSTEPKQEYDEHEGLERCAICGGCHHPVDREGNPLPTNIKEEVKSFNFVFSGNKTYINGQKINTKGKTISIWAQTDPVSGSYLETLLKE